MRTGELCWLCSHCFDILSFETVIPRIRIGYEKQNDHERPAHWRMPLIASVQNSLMEKSKSINSMLFVVVDTADLPSLSAFNPFSCVIASVA
jgi:hypothetical protein